jgi:hypothetical protein
MKTHIIRVEIRSVTEKVLNLYLAGFLEPNLTVSHLITGFDLVEHNVDGRSRLQRLIEEKLTINLTPRQIEQAAKLLEDYP